MTSRRPMTVFTLASGRCGLATDLEELVLFRVIHGLAGGGLQPASQGSLLDSFPPAMQGQAQTILGVAAVHSEQGRAYFFQLTGDPAASQQVTWQSLADLRQEQAASVAYFDVFWRFAALAIGLSLLVLLMRRSVVEKGRTSARSRPVTEERSRRHVQGRAECGQSR